MKYQGFYDYSLDSSGKPDRTFTAQQFCMYLKALLGNGIGITEATGDNAWKVEKTGDLTAKVILGDNGYNFASLNGNPFMVDEELSFIFSQGTDRWDTVLIRANATMEVRATDIVIQENNITYTRDTDIYDLRLARVHIVNNVITEIIDDRLNTDYCGIANGLVTVPTDELEELISSITSGSAVALKDGTLQTNLNAEMLGGKTITDLTSAIEGLDAIIKLSGFYNIAQVVKMWDSYNYLKLDNKITEYEKGMRVLIEPEQKYGNSFVSSIIPTFSSASKDNFSITASNVSDGYKAFDKDDSTYADASIKGTDYTAYLYLNFPIPIKPKKIQFKVNKATTNYNYTLYGTKLDGTNITLCTFSDADSGEVELNIDDYLTKIYLGVIAKASSSVTTHAYIYTLDIIEGECAMFNPSLNSYLNINDLGNKLINSLITPGTKYELVYDGETFNATEVA